ncbi:LuxR C-terminal-related transcriptional regulator [Streptomyces xanthophaeus]|uniref:LuxR C-terminal-related transcriptional regulator n=1 Tax=Streptomyces xanthophaeus TaxID=67385 RepID=UPI0036C918D3
MAAELLGMRLSHQAAGRLAHWSEGNPLLLRELIKSASSQHLFQSSPRGLELSDHGSLTAPLIELLTSKLHGLGKGAREALELLVLAEPVSLKRFSHLVTESMIAELESQELISVVAPSAAAIDSQPVVHVRRPLIGQLVLNELPTMRRRAHLGAWIATCDTTAAESDAEYRALTEWRLEINQPVGERDLLDAARSASVSQDLAAAVVLTRAAWARYPSFKTASLHALALVAIADFDSATDVLDEAERRGTGTDDELLSVRAHQYLLQGAYKEAEETVYRLRAPAPRTHLLAMSAYFQGKIDESIRLYESGFDVTNSVDEMEAAIFRIAALLQAGRPLDALELYRRAAQTIERVSTLYADSLEELHAVSLALLGRLDDAAELLTPAYEYAIRERRIRIAAQRGLALGSVLLERGRPRQAMELFEFHPAYQVGWQQWNQQARIGSILSSSMLGKPITNTRIPDLVPSHYYVHHAAALAWNAYFAGNRNQALLIMRDAVAVSEKNGAYAGVAVGVHEMARLGFADHTFPFWHASVQGPYLQARLDYSRALATSNIQLLRRAAKTFDTVKAEIFAAEAYAELAQLHRSNSQDRAATAASRKAAEYIRNCQGVTTPALLLLTSASPLSLRERELIFLVRQGLTDKEIADRLTLSVRTVSNHLYRIYRKLGADGRRDLRQVVDAEGNFPEGKATSQP